MLNCKKEFSDEAIDSDEKRFEYVSRKGLWLQMNGQEWQWDGTDEEFIELVQWALFFRKLAKEQPQGWLKSAFDKARMMSACNESGITKEAVSLEMKKAASVNEKRESNRKLIEAIEYTIEEEINGLINKGKCF